MAVVELIAATTTKAGLRVESALDTEIYKKGIKVSNAEIKTLNIQADPRMQLHHLSVGSSRVDLQACKLEYSIVSPK